ncbi:TonB-dependent receptor [Sphingomonas koreensis]|uniref:TonB-dependent receptor n=1 Tax=Sphingomonas koreensis TaxID=93064 RepID=A0A1L6JCD8_9SPHN|nr:TonB-dependent receptor [Sphingomonas koreensis]APR53575.1 TonB-dependent receptor [Sphingomonas koreensis]MDC7809700.1 TonB-dependent receptor [Sphingomonas koreensis]
MSLTTLSFLLLASASPAALAQETPPADVTVQEPAPPTVPGETGRDAEDVQRSSAASDIVVTARRRAEQVQDVPIPISVVGVKELDNTGSFNVARLAQLQPTLQFYSTNPRNSSVNIRGLGAPLGLTNDGIDQGVGVYIDQVYLSRVAVATLDFLDVSQIETLRGPQGTLYGKNTVAGAINITSKAPSFNFEGRAELSVGNLEFKQAKASISGPLGEDVAIRLGFAATDRRGTVFNVATGNYVNEQDNIGLRGALLWRATDTLSLTLSADYSRQNPECCAQIFVKLGSTQRPLNRQFNALAAAQGYEPASRNPFDRLTDLDADLNAKNVLGGVSLRAEWQLGSGTLTSVTAWRFWDWLPANDRDFTGLPITTLSQNPTRQDQFTQEFRYAGEGSGFDYVVGAFGFYQKIHTTGTQRQGPAASRWLINPSNALSNDPTVLDGLTAENDIQLKNFSGALFGKLNWKLTDQITLSPGVRVNYDDKVGSYISIVRDAQGNLVPYSGGTARQAAQREAIQPQAFTDEAYRAWNVTYDLTASYKPSRDVLLYATYAHTFKSGGLNLNGVPVVGGVVQTQLAQIEPEKVDHFEIGAKTQFWDRKATFNVTGFWTIIKDYQAIVNNSSTSTLRGYLANAGEVRVRGVEADFSIRPSDRFNLYVNGAYTDHEYVDFKNAPCPPELSGGGSGAVIGAPGAPGTNSPTVCDISGQWLPGISNWAFSYGAEYNLPAKLFGKDGEVYLGADASSRSRFSSNASRSIYTDIDGYTLANFRLGFRTDEGLNIFGWVRNAFDKKYLEVLATTPGNTGLISGNVGDPRTYGVTVGLSF